MVVLDVLATLSVVIIWKAGQSKNGSRSVDGSACPCRRIDGSGFVVESLRRLALSAVDAAVERSAIALACREGLAGGCLLGARCGRVVEDGLQFAPRGTGQCIEPFADSRPVGRSSGRVTTLPRTPRPQICQRPCLTFEGGRARASSGFSDAQ